AQTGQRAFHSSSHCGSFRSKLQFDIAFGGVDTDPHVLFGGLGDFTGAQIAQLAGLQRADTGVADPNSTAVGEVQTGLLAGFQDRRTAITFDSLLALEEANFAALAFTG